MALFPNIVTLEIRTSTYKFEGEKIQSITACISPGVGCQALTLQFLGHEDIWRSWGKVRVPRQWVIGTQWLRPLFTDTEVFYFLLTGRSSLAQPRRMPACGCLEQDGTMCDKLCQDSRSRNFQNNKKINWGLVALGEAFTMQMKHLLTGVVEPSARSTTAF